MAADDADLIEGLAQQLEGWHMVAGGLLRRRIVSPERLREALDAARVRATRAEVPALAEELTRPVEAGGQGLSNRQAAVVLGVGHSTINRAVGGPNGTAAPLPLGGEERANGPSGPPARALPAPLLQLETHAGEAVPYPQPQSPPTFNQTQGPGISWAMWSWNPVTGCLHGCDYCYAREIATGERSKAFYPRGFTPLFHHERLRAPLNTVLPAAHRGEAAPCEPFGCPWRRVFVCSMADLYGAWVPQEWIDRVHAAMLESPHWQYILLTKFPQRYVGLELPPNAWVGTSVDEQKRVRIAEEAFRKVEGVRVKWLSLEPLRTRLAFADLSMFDWVVIGAQTRTVQPTGVVEAFAPPFDWVAELVMQAKAAGCRVHLKPNLFGAPGMQPLNEYPT